MKIATSFVVAFASLAACAPIVAKKATTVDPISVQKRDEADTDVIFLTWSNGDKKLAVNKDDLPKNKDGEVDIDAVFLALNNYRAKKLQGNEGVVEKRDENDADVIFITWSNGDKKFAMNKDDLPKNKDGEVDTDAVFLALNNYRAKKLQGNEGVVEKRDENDADVIFVTWSNGDKKLASEEDGEADTDVVFVTWSNG